MAKEYIEREAALKAFPEARADMFENCRNCTCLDSEQIVMILKGMKAADVVEVVRCKDCKHCTPFYSDKGLCYLWAKNGIDVFLDGFCNYGAKMEVDNG